MNLADIQIIKDKEREVKAMLIPTPMPTTPEDPSPGVDGGYFDFGVGSQGGGDGDGDGDGEEGENGHWEVVIEGVKDVEGERRLDEMWSVDVCTG